MAMSVDNARIIELLEQQNALMQLLIDHHLYPLGFIEVGATMVYANGDHGWYMRQDGENVACPTDAISGFLTDIRTVTRSGEWGDRQKLLIRLRADRTYVVEAGVDSNFVKSFVASIHQVTANDLAKQITIQVHSGDKGKSTFCRVYLAGQYLKGPTWADCDWTALTQRALSLFPKEQGGTTQSSQSAASATASAPATPTAQGGDTYPQKFQALIANLSGDDGSYGYERVQVLAAELGYGTHIGKLTKDAAKHIRNAVLADWAHVRTGLDVPTLSKCLMEVIGKASSNAEAVNLWKQWVIENTPTQAA